MRKTRWLAAAQKDASSGQRKPAIYHCISRVVDRRLVFEKPEREAFRMCLRMYENFSGCRVLSYCIMSNHFHILLEVPPLPESGLTDDELLKRLSSLYSEALVADVAKQLATARADRNEPSAQEIHRRFTYRMHDLSQFMKGLLIRFTRWFNRTHSRTGTLWEERFKSLIVESGTAARTIAAYIDLNPVRAGIVTDPANYRWSSYGEAIGGGKKGTGKKARAGLVRAYLSDQEASFDPEKSHEKWGEIARSYRRLMGISLGKKTGRAIVKKPGKPITQNTAQLLAASDNETVLKDLTLAKILHCRVRYFTDGAVIGSRNFVNQTFEQARERFGPKRKDGARKLRGPAAPAANILWSLRDLRAE
jgi:putative transposase